MRNRRRGLCLRPQIDPLDERCLLSAGLSLTQVAAAYGLNAITFGKVNGTGSGETIALIEAYNDPTIASDLHTFDQAYNLPDPNLTVVNQSGGAVSATAQTNTGWAEEESLDVETAHAVAPGANILVVEANSQNMQDLLTAVNTARNTPGVVAVSMSWGFSETPNETSYDTYFTTPAGHIGGNGLPGGVTFIASSGDNGSLAGASYPAASPNVLSVGGTTLLLSSSGAYQSESAWIDSGGGYSKYEPEPSYQAKVQSTGYKATPDVAFDGDPNTGVQIYVTLPTRYGSQGSWITVGGTSLGSPAWAGIIAITDQGRALAGEPSLDGSTQTLPALYAAPTAAPTADFNTVAPASSSFGGGGGFGYGYSAFGSSSWFGGSGLGASATTSSSSTGANTATGLGSPNGPALVSDLVASTLTTPLTPVTGSGGGTTPTPTPPPNPVGGGPGRHHRLTHSGSRTVKSGKTHAEAPARSRHVKQRSVPKKLSTDRSLRG